MCILISQCSCIRYFWRLKTSILKLVIIIHLVFGRINCHRLIYCHFHTKCLLCTISCNFIGLLSTIHSRCILNVFPLTVFTYLPLISNLIWFCCSTNICCQRTFCKNLIFKSNWNFLWIGTFPFLCYYSRLRGRFFCIWFLHFWSGSLFRICFFREHGTICSLCSLYSLNLYTFCQYLNPHQRQHHQYRHQKCKMSSQLSSHFALSCLKLNCYLSGSTVDIFYICPPV